MVIAGANILDARMILGSPAVPCTAIARANIQSKSFGCSSATPLAGSGAVEVMRALRGPLLLAEEL
eukprot:10363452-Alexandrium_andersonii.AAC.1